MISLPLLGRSGQNPIPVAMTKLVTISVIVPVLHEEASINAHISHLRSLPTDGAPEIIIVDGDPSGSTVKTITQSGIITATSLPSRADQMNRGASLASGDVLLFLHADTFLPRNALTLMRNCLQDERIVGGAFSLGIASDRKIFRVTEKYVALRTRLTRVPFGDQAIFVRHQYFRGIGGYRSIPIMEDVEFMSRIRKNGDHVALLPEKVMTSARRWEKEGVLNGTLRNWMLQTLYCCGVAPERLARYYR